MGLILSGDIGGTKARLALIDSEANFAVEAVKEYPSRSFQSLNEAIRQFQKDHPHSPEKIGIGAAGPVINGKIDVTNLPWIIAAEELRDLGYKNPVIANDMSAYGAGVELLDKSGLICLNKGIPKAGNRALIAAGTGLGQSFLIPRPDKSWEVYGTEGGHSDFAPTTELEIDLLRFLRKRYRRVSWERVLSGLFGFDNIVRFLATQEAHQNEQSLLSDLGEPKEVGPKLTEAAKTGNNLAQASLRLFARLYGSEAGNLVLKYLAVNGLYIGGGIAEHLLPWLKDRIFMEGFTAKGRFSPILVDTPIFVITDKNCAIKGAALLALRGASVVQ